MLTSAAVAGLSAQQLPEPKFFSGCAVYSISENGKWVVSNCYEKIRLINLETGTETVFEDDGSYTYSYMATTINSVSNDGVLVADMDFNGTYATYNENGEWKRLDTADGVLSNNGANGITPDGTRICGIIGRSKLAITDDDVTMWVPAVWDRQADGSYGAPTFLPYPEKDLFGRNIQGANTMAITADGRTIAGTVTAATGMFEYPIVYKQADDGTWSYTLPSASSFNPNHVTLPPYPGESPAMPNYEDYMTTEEIDTYNQAVDDYWMDPDRDPELYPNVEDYMSAEAKTRYTADMAAYDVALNEWAPLFAAYQEAYEQIVADSPQFEKNQLGLATDGSGLAVTYTYEKAPDEDDPDAGWGWMPFGDTVKNVWYYDFNTNEVTKYDAKELSTCGYAGGYILAVETTDDGLYNGYLLKNGQYLSLYDFLCSKGENIKEWVDLNMVHEAEIYDWETGEVDVKNMTATGMPVATSNLSVLCSYTESLWGDYEPESYVFELGDGAAISEIVTDKRGVELDAEGNLLVGAGVAAVTVYDVAGRCVLNAASPAASVDCGNLAEGVYVVNVTYADGTTAATKVAK